jgi:hypothetical protein
MSANTKQGIRHRIDEPQYSFHTRRKRSIFFPSSGKDFPTRRMESTFLPETIKWDKTSVKRRLELILPEAAKARLGAKMRI